MTAKSVTNFDIDVLHASEVAQVAGGMINQRTERPIKPPIEPGHTGGGVGYFLPEMEMDTGIIFLH
jgi:hypothetical protein